MQAHSSDRFAALETRMLQPSGDAPPTEFSIGFKQSSNPPSSPALEYTHRSPSPSLGAAAHREGGGSPSPAGDTVPKRKQSPQELATSSPDKRRKPVPSPQAAGAKRPLARSPDAGALRPC